MVALCAFAGSAMAFQGVPGAADQGEDAEPAQMADENPAPTHYVEFRVADNGLYGHSYLAYGKLDDAGRPANAAYADIHPTGELPSLVLGHFFPIRATTTPSNATQRRKVASRYFRPLTTAEYQTLVAVIARTRAARHEWSVVNYNCNDFVAEVARGIGLQTPDTLALPYDFIPQLQAMNEPAASASLPIAARPVPPAPLRQAPRSSTASLLAAVTGRPVPPAPVPVAASPTR